MTPPLKFSFTGVTVSGEWDEVHKMVLITGLDGDLVLEANFLGVPVLVRGKIDTAMDNCVRVKINSIGQMKGFLIPGILNLLKTFNRKFAQFASVERDMILIDPSLLIQGNGDFKILIQPKTLEIPDQAVVSLRERILAWTEKNAGAVAKDIMEFVLTIPDLAALLVDLAKDPRIRPELKLKIALCIAYVIAPVDLIPEILSGPLGFVDDAAAIRLLVTGLVAEIPADLIREHWKGQNEMLELILKGHALAALFAKLPKGIFPKLVSLFGKAKRETAAGKDF